MKLFAKTLVLMSLLPLATAAQSRTAPPPAQKPGTYESVTIDGNGDMRITTSDRREIVVPKDGEMESSGKQTRFDTPVLSPDHRAVGAQAEYGNCCTSYDIPLELVVYSQGRVHRFRGIDLPIFQWGFADGGRRIAYGQESVHFSCATYFEMRDVRSEKRIASFSVPEPCGQIPDTPKVRHIPQWVTDLMRATKEEAMKEKAEWERAHASPAPQPAPPVPAPVAPGQR